MAKHKHAELIKAWADGASIQVFSTRHGIWEDVVGPAWCEGVFYRIKPEPNPDLVVNAIMKFRNVWKAPAVNVSWNGEDCPAGYRHYMDDKEQHHLRFVFDGETDQLKSVEIIK